MARCFGKRIRSSAHSIPQTTESLFINAEDDQGPSESSIHRPPVARRPSSAPRSGPFAATATRQALGSERSSPLIKRSTTVLWAAPRVGSFSNSVLQREGGLTLIIQRLALQLLQLRELPRFQPAAPRRRR
jgi:hypothetical protein